MDKAKKKKHSLEKMVSVKKKRFILYRQQSILCNVADIKHFGGKSGNLFSINHTDSCT